jgi:hypothetical protein
LKNTDGFIVRVVGGLETSLNNINEVIYYILLKLKQMFNLDCLIPLTETQLRKKFS